MIKERFVFRLIVLFLVFLLIFSPVLVSLSTMQSEEIKPESKIKKNQFTESLLPKMMVKIVEKPLYEHVKSIAAFGPHPTESIALDQVCTYIFNTFQSMNIQVEYNPWQTEDISGKNIVATLPGVSNNLVIVTAHADTIAVSPGADDDGSGIASIFSIANMMKSYTFNATVKFIIFTGEEIGLLGSSDNARRAFESNQEIIGVLSLDKIAYATTKTEGNIIRHHSGEESDWMISISKQIANKYSPLIGLDVLGLPFDASSDHCAFVNYGFFGSNLVEHALNPFYHTSEDTIHHINSTYLKKVTRLALGIVTKLASLEPVIKKEDITIDIKGSFLSNPSKLTITLENKKHAIETANVNISIVMKHIFKDAYVESVKEYYTDPCIWNITTEIGKQWMFEIGPRVMTKGFFTIDVIIRGSEDDLGLYLKESTKGFIFYPNHILLYPVY